MKTYCKKTNILSDEHLNMCFDVFYNHNKSRKEFHSFFSQGKETILNEIRSMVTNRKIKLAPIVYFERIEPTSRKLRVIGRESAMQQLLDYISVYALMPLFQAKLGYHQCASIKGKGQAHALRYLRRWSKNKQNRYYVKIDIRKFYPSIDCQVLISMLSKDIRNPDLLWLIKTLIGTYKHGLSIGSFLSQYLANYYLSEAFRYANNLHKEKRNKKIKLMRHILTYMDDWIFIGSRKADIKSAVRKVIRFLNDKLHLEVKPWKVCKIDSEPIDMVGYVFWRDHVSIRAVIFIRARRSFLRIQRASIITYRMAARCLAYFGYFKWSNSRVFIKRNRLDSLIKICKDRVAMFQYEKNTYEIIPKVNKRKEQACQQKITVQR